MQHIITRHPSIANQHVSWGKIEEGENPTDEFLTKISDYFQKRIEKESLTRNSGCWDPIVGGHGSIIEDLKNKNFENLRSTFRKICSSNLSVGISGGDNCFKARMNSEDERQKYAVIQYDRLVTLMEFAGIIEMFWQEIYDSNKLFNYHLEQKPEFHLQKIAERYNFDISAPKDAGGQYGLKTDYGIYSERDMWALEVAMRVSDCFKNKNIKICEIGGGFGHLAYYLNKMGFTNYTIVDLPTISVSQMYFLGMNLGEEKVNFISPEDFDGKYDLVLNVDSMPEMGRDTAKKYCDIMKNNSNYFMSVNIENISHRGYTVNQLCEMDKVARNIFWTRFGYVVEEWVR